MTQYNLARKGLKVAKVKLISNTFKSSQKLLEALLEADFTALSNATFEALFKALV